MTRSTSTPAHLSHGELHQLLDALRVACKILLALEPILKRGIAATK